MSILCVLFPTQTRAFRPKLGSSPIPIQRLPPPIPYPGMQVIRLRRILVFSRFLNLTDFQSIVPTDLQQVVTGRRGENIRDIVFRYDVSVSFPAINATTQSISVTSKDQYKAWAARDELDRLLQALNLDAYAKTTLYVPGFFREHMKRYTPDVILEISEQYDVFITVSMRHLFPVKRSSYDSTSFYNAISFSANRKSFPT